MNRGEFNLKMGHVVDRMIAATSRIEKGIRRGRLAGKDATLLNLYEKLVTVLRGELIPEVEDLIGRKRATSDAFSLPLSDTLKWDLIEFLKSVISKIDNPEARKQSIAEFRELLAGLGWEEDAGIGPEKALDARPAQGSSSPYSPDYDKAADKLSASFGQTLGKYFRKPPRHISRGGFGTQ